MVSRAQLSQQRSRRRRETLLEAAVDIFVEGGSRAVTHRAVSSKAGLPSATTTYYFESIQVLLREALASQITLWRGQLEALAGGAQKLRLEDALELIAETLGERPEGRARRELAVYLEASADPILHDLARDLSVAIEDFLHDVLARVDAPDPRRLAKGLSRITTGSAVFQASLPEEIEEERRQLRTNLRALTSYHFAQNGTVNPFAS